MLRRTRRAPSACAWCHHRKVRCDASILGCPCTRCRQDGRSDCVLRAKLPKQSKPPDRTLPSIREPVTKKRTPEPISPIKVRGAGQESLNSNASTTNSFKAHTESRNGARQSLNNLDEYPFLILDALTSLQPEDVTYLCSKGAFSLPDRRFAQVFITEYLKRIHPIVPVLEEISLWNAFHRDTREQVSLFVFQALLFASCPFVPLDVLRQCGFVDKRDARKQLYNRAMLLFDLSVETRPSAKAQGALLLTHHTSAEAPQAGSLWLTRAIESALLIDAQPSPMIEDFPKSLKKRLWWSILIRDRSLCIGLRRRPQITSVNMHGFQEWLTKDDFEDELYDSPIYDTEAKRHLLAALEEQCHLAVLLTDLVTLIFTPRITPTASSTSSEAFSTLMAAIQNTKDTLVQWEMQAQPPSNPMVISETHDPAATLKNLTFMYYHAARVDLAQFAALAIEEHLAATSLMYRKAVAGVGWDLQNAMDGLTRVMEYFSLNGHMEYLPLSVLGYVGMPLVLAAIDLKLSPSYNEMTRRQKRLDSLSKIIRHSENLYDVTDFVAAGTNHILQLAYITTQNFFLPCDLPLGPAAGGEGASMTGNSMMNVSDSKKAGSLTHTRARSWLDAFIRCPRAYLLISTSVDYSLAVGRLPYDNSLPALVRHIPSMGAVARLPWTVHTDTYPDGPHIRPREHGKYTARRSGSADSKTTVRTLSTETGEQILSSQNTSGHHIQPRVDNATTSGRGHIYMRNEPAFEQIGHQVIAAPKDMVNLDFLDLDGSCLASSGSTPITIMQSTTHHALDNLFVESDIEARAVDGDFDSVFFHSLLHDSLVVNGAIL